ncbi:hypothetical protein ARMGADRAFT_1009331 [Armillaria gallica]|uniref:Uncharacterized protein n=1 Tax=Armillaria gallica TaxID=47427 RepID=A0A2H3E9L4_ARMGA|nr:hypothetical protein ARMGADRAFT_1009331 [Armillaria gallica]
MFQEDDNLGRIFQPVQKSKPSLSISDVDQEKKPPEDNNDHEVMRRGALSESNETNADRKLNEPANCGPKGLTKCGLPLNLMAA